MTKFCDKCDAEYDPAAKKCPVCGGKLKEHYTEEELEQIQKENDDFTVVNTLLM
ncbi:MAG: hypothetical protein LBN02_01560 [Oscillospiraceae bacterium]|jgi:predicted amidophosphoribosyltransferase|nr:hypothetical protein [Oscillospiraceae bacterium]